MLVNYPLEQSAGPDSLTPDASQSEEPIAIIGMACRFPGAEGLPAFWRLLETGGNAVTEGSPGSGAGRVGELFPDASLDLPACRFGAYVDGIDLFDPAFFRVSPVEAQLLDPQQRMMLEVSWQALEDAGIDPEGLKNSRAGVYTGISNIEYRALILDSTEPAEPAASLYTLSGTTLNSVSGRVSFVLGLKGPAMAVDAACSSSLVAVHQAVTALQQGEASLALAGGVQAILDGPSFEHRATAGMLSPDGQCKTFDASADGYVRGEGCGVIVLKRLSEAEADSDRIWGVIRGSAVNHGGTGTGLTVPNGTAQEQVIEEALSRAGVAPADVDYLEAHGTGTEVGDPIEVNAAVAVYGREREPEHPLLIGSVKTNIGHLEPASGIAGLIKAALAMKLGMIPKHLNLVNPNPKLDWERLPVRVTTENTDWPRHPHRPPLAGVSAYGISGTNAHVVIEGYEGPGESAPGNTPWAPGSPQKAEVCLPEPVAGLPTADAELKERRTRFFPLSAKSGAALRELAQRYLSWLPVLAQENEGAGEPALADMAWTAGVGRSHFQYRAGLPFRDAASLREKLHMLSEGDDRPPSYPANKVAFVYTGQGSQWSGMGKELYDSEPVARAVFDRCEEVFREARGQSLLDVMFGRDGSDEELSDTAWEQPALYALGCALTALWTGAGVRPAVVMGHSVGEIAAAQAAGVFSLEDGMRLAAARGTLLSGTGHGAMAAVFAPAELVATTVAELNAASDGVGLSVAADNGTHQVISGPTEKIEAISERLESEEIRVRRLNTSRAFHSELLEPALDPLEAFIGGMAVEPPSLAALVSNVTGEVVGPGELLDGAYWRRHARQPVAFAGGVRTLADLGVDVVVEIGPHSVLGPMASLAWPQQANAPVVLSSLLRPPRGEAEPEAGFVDAVAAAYEAGMDVSFAGLFAGESRRRVPLPGYPFQRTRFWIEGGKRRRTAAGHPLLGNRHESPRGEVLFQSEASPSEPSWMTDHRVHSRVVAPGALYGAMAALAQLSEDTGTVLVEDAQLHSPLIFPEEGDDTGQGENVRQLQLVLDAADGVGSRRVGIFSKGPFSERHGEGWTQHFEGRVHAGAIAPKIEAWTDLARLKAGLSREDVPAFYQVKSASGIDFGPAFRGVQALWTGAGEAFGEIALPTSVERNGIDIHPLLLDGCFQILAASRDESVRSETTYMPFGWERMWLAGPLPERIVCHVQLRQDTGEGQADAPALEQEAGQPPETLTADLRIYAPDGSALGELSGFTVKRATRAALLSAVEGLDGLFYETVWRDRPLAESAPSADFLTGPAEIASRIEAYSAYLAEEGADIAERDGYLADMQRLAQSYTLSALEQLGWRRQARERIEPEGLLNRLNILPTHRRLLERLIEMMTEVGLLEEARGGRVVAVGAEFPLPDESLGNPESLAARMMDKYPYASVEIGLLQRCGSALADVLSGRADPLELLFGGEPNAADMYRKAPAWQAANRMIGDAVAAAVSGLPEEGRLRVLEVGAGTGSATALVMPQLPAGRFEYFYTDVSAGFFAEAEERFGKRDEPVEFRVLNIESDPVAQGFDSHGYDLVIAANVIHATRDLGETLSHCRELLAPSGELIALEGLRGQDWRDLIFGLVEGWWRYDDDYRLDHALATPPVWRRALRDAGYGEVEVLGADEPGGDAPERGVIVARGPATVAEPPGLWILAADVGGAADELAAQLTDRNQTVVLARDEAAYSDTPPERPGIFKASVDARSRESWRSLVEGLPKDAPLKGVVHLTALDGHGPQATTDDLKEDITLAAGNALALVQGLIEADTSPAQGVWFVTRGAQAQEREPAGELAGATLWGFGKVMAREASNLRPRMIDLDPEETSLPPGFINELLSPDTENHIAYRQDTRRVARLVRSGRQTPPEEHQPERVRDDRTYLVTGGLGGIGCAVAEWLADRGAGAIVLNGRRSPDPAAEGVIAALRQRGATVQVELADVTDDTAVQEMLARIDATLPPLGGVIHSVGALADASLSNQTWERFERVLWPKVLGAWRLHRATESRDLDLFILFSSMSGVRGNPGQANYAAANAFLDRLALHRRGLGLAGQVIQWGAWAGVGEAEEQRERIGDSLAAFGSGWMTPQQGIRALDRLVLQDTASAAVGIMDWPVFAASLPDPMPLIEDLLSKAPAKAASTTAPSDNLLSRLREAPVAEREGLLASFLQGELQAVLRLPSPPSPSIRFFDLGMDSLMAVELRNRMNRAFAGEYTAPNTIVFDYPDTASLARYLAGELDKADRPEAQTQWHTLERRVPQRQADNGIAIVGMACRFPGASDLSAFWRLLETGGNAVTDGRNGSGSWGGFVGDPDAKDALYRRGAFVEGLDQFDAGFFRIPPVEARILDPQQRMLLETTWQALEDAGINPDRLKGSRTGVYAGIGASEYRDVTAAGGGASYFGTGASMAVGRVSYELGLEGPAMPVEMACASSLAAVHQAAAGLRQGEVDLALAGGVNAVLSPAITREMAEVGMLSRSGQSRAFDAAADGYVRGEGCGMLVLKRLDDAEADGDRIWGVIRGSAVNQNGASAGPTAPNGPAQQRVIADALAQAGIAPQDVDYLEAHGVGSGLGDPIEVQAAASVYGRGRDAGQPLLIGSVKPNIGHLESASGIAALIKAALSLNRGMIPGLAHFQNPSPHVNWEQLPVRITPATTAWPSHPGRPPLAGVSAIGISGANAHVVLAGYREQDASDNGRADWPVGAGQAVQAPLAGQSAEHPLPGEAPSARKTRLLPLSAKSDAALRELAKRYLSRLDEFSDSVPEEAEYVSRRLADMAWTASVGRSHFAHRAGVVFHDTASLRDELAKLATTGDGHGSREVNKVAYLYNRQGNDWAGMRERLYECEPVARAVLERCDAVYWGLTGASLPEVKLDGEDSHAGTGDSQVALYAIECALTALWDSLGVTPGAAVGHNGGELAAAQASGVIYLEDGIRFALEGSAAYPAGVDAALGDISAGEQGVDFVVEIGPGMGFAETVARAYEAGLDVSLAGMFAGESRRRVSLPGYPFQRRHWLEASNRVTKYFE